jgi:hypothetical protein
MLGRRVTKLTNLRSAADPTYLPFYPPKPIFDTDLLIAYDATDQYPRPRPQKLERRGRLRDTRPTELPKLGTVIDGF